MGRRSSGILVHPTSLPGRFGSGELGAEALALIDFLQAARQRRWQVLPLGPTGYGDSPYQSFSTFAGNPLLISLEQLAADGWLTPTDLDRYPSLPDERIDFGAVIPARWAALRRAFERFQATADAERRRALADFVAAERDWLDDYALFMALKTVHGGAAWSAWPVSVRRREPATLAHWRQRAAAEIELHRFVQWQFFAQWRRVHRYASERDIRIIGDLPIFVALDSADVWANPELFQLDDQGRPTAVAGVPPDYFSATGQLWGNPLYRWERLAASGYAWWIARVRATLNLVDIVRIDHFRGFEAYWEVPAGESTAINGRWVPGPGTALFDALRSGLGRMPIIAEDLGLITPAVEALRDEQGLPGMAVLQFGFGDTAVNPHLPHNLRRNQIIYTGTHDNDTTNGWYASAAPAVREHLQRYLGYWSGDAATSLRRLALASVAETAILPLQDLLGLGSDGRMNWPGRAAGNWSWRYRAEQLTAALAVDLAEQTLLYGRAEPPV